MRKKEVKMDKSVQITLIIAVSVLVIVGAIIGTFNYYAGPQKTINGNGEATIKVVPDLVSVYFNIETKDDSSEIARNENAEIVEELIISLIREGFNREDIVTQSFNLYPNYDWGEDGRTENGFVASHQLKVELSTEESDKIGELIDAGVNAGAQISYINFELSSELQNEYKAKAIKLAAEDAKVKAKAMAEGLDKEIGELVSVSSSNFNYSPWRAFGMVEDMEGAELVREATTDIQPGEREISAQVNAKFKLK